MVITQKYIIWKISEINKNITTNIYNYVIMNQVNLLPIFIVTSFNDS